MLTAVRSLPVCLGISLIVSLSSGSRKRNLAGYLVSKTPQILVFGPYFRPGIILSQRCEWMIVAIDKCPVYSSGQFICTYIYTYTYMPVEPWGEAPSHAQWYFEDKWNDFVGE